MDRRLHSKLWRLSLFSKLQVEDLVMLQTSYGILAENFTKHRLWCQLLSVFPVYAPGDVHRKSFSCNIADTLSIDFSESVVCLISDFDSIELYITRTRK